MKSGWVLNKQFNRYERAGLHVYETKFNEHDWSTRHEGRLKCRLVHGRGFSLVVPDLLFVGPAFESWIQPLQFLPNLVQKTDADVFGSVWVDISGGANVRVDFRSKGLIRQLDDGSELYSCTIHGPADLSQRATGACEWRGGSPFLRLFHHSTEAAIDGIRKSGAFRLSRWNIQGTKELEHVGYVYFTPLDAILCDADLQQIAMASEGEIFLATDQYQGPMVVTRGAAVPRDVLRLEVYRANTADRRHSLAVWVEASALGAQHLQRHAPPGRPVYYEIVGPFIHRVGAAQGQVVPLVGDTLDPSAVRRRFDYVIVGDATTVDGLGAPYDEEHTKHIAKIERPGNGILPFWFENGNAELFSRLTPELMSFARRSPPSVAPIAGKVRVGRNDPCPCGSGAKYKKCCLDKQETL